jgi:Raf kinase inhibitor-like YbhB/YbcL family protein
LTSEKITAGVKIATELTCAMNTHPNPPSPPFAWTPGPAATLSYALVMYDPTPKFTHWVVWDIPPSALMLPASLGPSAMLAMPAGAKQAAGSGMGYLGPCPPGNATHTYEFTIYALDIATLPGVTTSTTTANLVTAIQMHDIASAMLSAPSDGK